MTCINTRGLSACECLQDTGRLKPGIWTTELQLILVFIWILSWTCRNSITPCDCLCSYCQGVMSKVYVVCTRVTHLCNRFQIACAISWSIPGLCAINAKTGHSHLRGAHHLSLPTLCVGLHSMTPPSTDRGGWVLQAISSVKVCVT